MDDVALQVELAKLVAERPRLEREARDLAARTTFRFVRRVWERGGWTTEYLVIIEPPSKETRR